MDFIKQLIEDISPEDVTLNIKYHDNLNPALWSKTALRPEVQKKLVDIADLFIEFLKVPNLKVSDVILTGSGANYNWTSQSDIDLHIILDLKTIKETCGEDITAELFAAKKKVWNDMHDIMIHGFNVELYTQDKNEKHVSTGVYSIKNNKWIVKPTHKEPKFDHSTVKAKSAHIMNEIDNLHSGSASKIEEVEKLKEKLKKLRQSGLEKEGEFSVENLVFKTLRNNGYLEKLFDMYTNAIDKELSL